MKILVLTSRIPWPLEKGDKLRLYYQIRELSRRHEIVLCCLSESGINEEARQALNPFCSRIEILRLGHFRRWLNVALGVLSRRPFQVLYFYQRSALRHIRTVIAEERPQHIYCQLIRCAEYVKDIVEIPKTIDFMDALSSGMRRRAAASGFLSRWVFLEEAERLERYEQIIYEYFDHHTIISHQDRALLKHPRRDQIQVIRNGIDSSFFASVVSSYSFQLLFSGNMSYPPNVEAAKRLVKNILPELQNYFPEMNVMLAGANPARAVMNLQSDNVMVTGWMEDIRIAYASAKVFVAPMITGSGMQNKLLEAMAAGLPCVTTPIAASALQAQHGVNILVCDCDEEFVIAIQKLIEDDVYYHRIASAAKNFVEQNFRWENSVKELESLLLP
jgi:sugar transferase (PEP-CTERM/EpsH1 system associated)